MPSSLCPRYCHVTVCELNRGPYVYAFVNAIPIILPCTIFSERLQSKSWWEFSHSLFVCKNADLMKWNLFVENICSSKEASQIHK